MSKLNPLNSINCSWNPIKHLLYEDPNLVHLRDELLPNISYQPKRENIFRAFSMPLKNIKVVILGQDPYPTPGDAVGYAFAKPPLKKFPVSLRNIQKEVVDSGMINDSGEIDLYAWVDQGVLLLNTALTVETGKAGSHLKYWENFTNKVINYISSAQPCIWILWGAKAQSFAKSIRNPVMVRGYDKETIKNIPIQDGANYVLTAPHPAAEAYAGGKAGFFGCNHFYYTNEILKAQRLQPIIW